MKERPILFSAPMIRALLAGTKTQTRRAIKPQQPKPSRSEPYEWELTERDGQITCYTTEQFVAAKCRYGAPGDRLYVRESWRTVHSLDLIRPVALAETVPVHYEADDSNRGKFREPVGRGRSSLHMPRWASRITLEVRDVRIERVQAISEADARAEGVERDTEPCDHTRLSCEEIGCMGPTYRSTYAELWQEINGTESWDANPFVWVVDAAIRGAP